MLHSIYVFLRILTVIIFIGREVTQLRHFKQTVELLFVKNFRPLTYVRHIIKLSYSWINKTKLRILLK